MGPPKRLFSGWPRSGPYTHTVTAHSGVARVPCAMAVGHEIFLQNCRVWSEK